MTKLTAKQVDHLTDLMDQRFDREMAEIKALTARWRKERDQEFLEGRPADHSDEALLEEALGVDDAIVRQDIEDVRDIMAARRRLSAGEYGICVDCGDDIGYERLLAYPTAKRCIDCQRRHERHKAAREG